MYCVEISGRDGYVFDVKTRDSAFTIAAKEGNVRPSEALLASIASCIGVYIRKYAEGAKLEIGEFTVTIKSEFGKERPIYFRHIDISVDLKGFRLDERRREAFLRFIKNCPVHATLKSNPEIKIDLV